MSAIVYSRNRDPSSAATARHRGLSPAQQVFDLADRITLPFFEQRSFHLSWKENRTEVTSFTSGSG